MWGFASAVLYLISYVAVGFRRSMCPQILSAYRYTALSTQGARLAGRLCSKNRMVLNVPYIWGWMSTVQEAPPGLERGALGLQPYGCRRFLGVYRLSGGGSP